MSGAVSHAADAVAKVSHATVSFENSEPLQLALVDADVLKQPPTAQQDRNQVDLELVEPSAREFVGLTSGYHGPRRHRLV